MLTEDQKEVCIKAVSAIAWADGTQDTVESEYFKSVILDFGYHNEQKVHDLLTNKPDFNFSEIKSLPNDTQLDLLKMSYHMANVSGGVSESEKSIIKTFAMEILGSYKWDSVEKWLSSYSNYLCATKDFFQGDK